MKRHLRQPKQMSSASHECAPAQRVTRRETLLGEMEQAVPWEKLEAMIEPHYPISERVNRRPMGLARMLRMYLLQQWFTLTDGAVA